MPDSIPAQCGEYISGNTSGAKLTFSGDRIIYGGNDPESANVRIPTDAITTVRTDIDKSVTGFRAISLIIALAALAFTMLTLLMFSNDAELNMITAGTALTATGAWAAAGQFYRAERGATNILRIETDDGQHTFYTQADDDAFDDLVEAIQTTQQRAPTEAGTAVAQ